MSDSNNVHILRGLCANTHICLNTYFIGDRMVSMTLSIPKDLHQLIKKHTEIRWSEIARRAMWDYVRKIEFLDEIASKSKLTDEDVDEINKELKKAVHSHYEEHVE
jgi:hypothetical protein